jgi:hypothetical protein
MKTSQSLNFAIAVLMVINSIWATSFVRAQTVVWDRQAFGQPQTDPCGNPFNWPNNNNWSQQEVDAMACNQTYVLQPSNWTTPTYPNGANLDVVLGAPAPTNLDLQVTLHSLTVQSGAGDLNMQAGSSFDVQSYDFQTDGTFTQGGGGGINPFIRVAGTFLKSAGTGVLDISGGNYGVFFNLEGGTIQVNAGTLKLSRGTSTGGTFNVATNSAVDITNGSEFVFWSGNYGGSGSGAVQLNNGGIQFQTPAGTFNFSDGLFQWTGGYIFAGGNSPLLTNIGTMNLIGSDNKEIDGGGFHNAGMIIQTGTGNLVFGGNSFMTNDATGTYDIQSDSGMGSNGEIDNYGTFKKSAGTGTSTIFANSDPDDFYFNLLGGTVEADSGTLKLPRSYPGSTGGNFIVGQGAVIDLNSGTIFSANYSGTYTGSGDGELQMNSGAITVVSPGATFNFEADLFQWSGGTIYNNVPDGFVNAGTISVAGNVAVGGYGCTNDGTLKGNGNLQFTGSPGSLTNNGTIAPGNSLGRLDIGFSSGNLNLTSTSNLSFQIGGTEQGSSYDLLNKTDTGPLVLNGKLTVQLINGFTPASTDIFTIVTTQQTLQGAFSNVPSGARLDVAGATGSFIVNYSGMNNVTLSNFSLSGPPTRRTPSPRARPTPHPRPGR